jgi:hypothetical protein
MGVWAGVVNGKLTNIIGHEFDREGKMSYAKSEEEWGKKAAAHLKARMREAGVTYAELVKLLKKHGFKSETEAGITMKLKRGAFAAGFLLACLAALELEGVRLEDL